MRAVFSWLARNLGTLLLSLLLALVVWVSAVITADPNRQQTSRPIEIQVMGQDPNLLQVGSVPRQAVLTLQAPQSIWDQLNNNPGLMSAWIDLSGLGAGKHQVEVKARVDASPVRLIKVEPEEVSVVLEPLLRKTFPVELRLRGSLPLGYQKSNPTIVPTEVIVTGAESMVNQVVRVQTTLDISGATQNIQQTAPVEAVDENGLPVTGVTLSPREVNVEMSVSLLGGFKNAAVKVVTKGQVANGYRLTNIIVSPPTVTLFSDNPKLIEQIPGFVETMPVDLTNLTDDLEIAVDLNLPNGVTLVREPNVLVQVSVAAIEGTMTLSVPVEIVGLSPELQAIISPETVDVIVSGPINILETLTPANFRVILDLTGLPAGVYQRSVEVDLSPKDVRVQTTLPESVEVTIELASAPNPTGTQTLSPTPTFTPPPAPSS